MLSQMSALRAVHFDSHIFKHEQRHVVGLVAAVTCRGLCAAVGFWFYEQRPPCSLPLLAVRLVGGLPSGGDVPASSGNHLEPSVAPNSARHFLFVTGQGVVIVVCQE